MKRSGATSIAAAPVTRGWLQPLKSLAYLGSDRIGPAAVRTAVALLVVACALRYLRFPSFWLDEAFVAVSLRSPSLHGIFGPLEYGQYFPRIYLGTIALLREVAGYRIGVLRLLPFLCFIAATVFWGRLLMKRVSGQPALGLLAAALLLGGSMWLDEGIQLKQYTFDVMLALVPFLVEDVFFERALVGGEKKVWLVWIALPCALSYTYPLALGARVVGWYVDHGRRAGWRLKASAVLTLMGACLIALSGIWLTDLRYNLRNQASYLAYWEQCSLRVRLSEGLGAGLRLIADFIWGWHHGRLMPLVTLVIAPLQLLGVYSVILRWKNRDVAARFGWWGSRSIGSLALLGGVILASIVFNYPICAGRLVLFAQIHTQILALEGGLFALRFKRQGLARAFTYVCVAVVAVYSAHRYVIFLREEPPENIRPMLALIHPEVSNTVWVQSCSVAQVRSLPDPLPVENVVLGTGSGFPERGQTVWVLWTHMGEDRCREQLERMRRRAISWEIVHEGPGRGLALARF